MPPKVTWSQWEHFTLWTDIEAMPDAKKSHMVKMGTLYITDRLHTDKAAWTILNDQAKLIYVMGGRSK
jgi:hypothetical protein